MTHSDTLTTATATGVLEARIANLRATMATVAVRLRDDDESVELLASALEIALLDDEKAANR